MASKHVRRGSGRAALPRRTTRGPLDEDDPLSATSSAIASPLRSSVASPLEASPIPAERETPVVPGPTPLALPEARVEVAQPEVKDLSFLLDPSIYHPLSQLETAPPFRHPFPPVPSRSTPLSSSLAQLDSLLAKCDFLSAAHLSASILASGTVPPTDVRTVFQLIGLRYSCLELTGNVLLAAQEAKALEDLTSDFYYAEQSPRDPSNITQGQGNAPAQHIVPFTLRLQALRLQSIGFSDPRRGVSVLYEVGLECRENIASSYTSEEDRNVWASRLDEVGIRVVNALVELGDIDCATRTLGSMRPTTPSMSSSWAHQMALLYIRMGDLNQARDILSGEQGSNQAGTAMMPLLAVAEGRYEEAVQLWETQVVTVGDSGYGALLKQNLAVAYLYSGCFQKARGLLEELVEAGHSFQSLTMNLATLYELSSDRSRDLKIALAGKIAKQQQGTGQAPSRTNVDFKL